MNTNPKIYYEFFVRENFSEFNHRPGDVRLAFNAATSAFHMTDVFYLYSKRNEPQRVAEWKKQKDFIIYLNEIEPQFRIIQSVATIYKHMYVAKPYLDGASPQSVKGMVARNGIAVESAWSSTDGSDITIRRRDGSEASISIALDQVVERMWPCILGETWPT